MLKPTRKTTPTATPPALQAEPDLVDRIFDYLAADFAHLDLSAHKAAVRAEFAGERCYIQGRPVTARQQIAAQVLCLFDGRNATEVARRLNISRATVYRLIKQPGGVKAKTVSSLAGFETP